MKQTGKRAKAWHGFRTPILGKEPCYGFIHKKPITICQGSAHEETSKRQLSSTINLRRWWKHQNQQVGFHCIKVIGVIRFIRPTRQRVVKICKDEAGLVSLSVILYCKNCRYFSATHETDGVWANHNRPHGIRETVDMALCAHNRQIEPGSELDMRWMRQQKDGLWIRPSKKNFINCWCVFSVLPIFCEWSCCRLGMTFLLPAEISQAYYCKQQSPEMKRHWQGFRESWYKSCSDIRFERLSSKLISSSHCVHTVPIKKLPNTTSLHSSLVRTIGKANTAAIHFAHPAIITKKDSCTTSV